MPLSLSDYKRPHKDNGRGIQISTAHGWNGGGQGLAYWLSELRSLGIKWAKVVDDGGDSLPLCEQLLSSGIFPIVRILRRDPAPNDAPEPNPGHLNPKEEQTIKRLIATGVLYFETNSEPDTSAEWKHAAIPSEAAEAAKLIALNWLFDARFILDSGAYPGLPALQVGSSIDLLSALSALNRLDSLLEGCWIAIHNYGLNHPVDYPNDDVVQAGAPIGAKQYDVGLLTSWAWWNVQKGRADTLEEINLLRIKGKASGATILDDHYCFREYDYYNALAQKYLGCSIPILSSEGGFLIGSRHDPRYPRVTPERQADLTVAMFDFTQRLGPDYYFACIGGTLAPSSGRDVEAWYGDYWKGAFKTGLGSRAAFPPLPIAGYTLSPHLPVVDAVKAMPKIVRVREELGPPSSVPELGLPGRGPIAPPLAPKYSGMAQLDPRLSALGVHISPATIVRGLPYWKLLNAVYQDPIESQGNHNIYYSVLDENGNPIAGACVLQSKADVQLDATTDATGNAQIQMGGSFSPERGEQGPYSAWIDGLPSDRVIGLGRPHKRNVSYHLTWLKTSSQNAD